VDDAGPDSSVSSGGRGPAEPDSGAGGALACGEFELFASKLEGSAIGQSVAVDIDGDDDLDLVSYTMDSLVIFRNEGRRQFAPAETYAERVRMITVADVTGDGRPEILVSTFPNPNELVVWNNPGDGTFTRGRAYSTDYPIAVFVGDIDVDGKQDIVLNGQDPDPADPKGGILTIDVLRNTGDGFVPLDGQFPAIDLIALGDFDHDGRTDFSGVTNEYKRVVSYRNMVAGFSLAYEYVAPPNGEGIARALDYDGDGEMDLLGGDSHVLLMGVGDGTFVPAPLVYPVPLRGPPIILDIDGDERSDFLGSDGNGNTIPYLNPEGGLQRLQRDWGGLGGFLLSADLDRDGTPDVVTKSGIYWSGPEGRYPGPITMDALAPAGSETEAAAADFNGDGHDDFIVSPRPSGGTEPLEFLVYIATGSMTFAAPLSFRRSPDESRLLRTLPVLDLDGDGAVDVVVAGDHQLSFLHNSGTGALSATSPTPLSDSPRWVVSGDVDDDGDSDLLAGTDDLDLVGIPVPTSIELLTNDGAGHFVVTTAFTSPWTCLGTVLSDFDRDGNADLAVTLRDETAVMPKVTIAYGDGQGHFGRLGTFELPRYGRLALAADFDGDGYPDLAMAAHSVGDQPERVVVLMNQKDGTFTTRSEYAVGPSAQDLDTADFDSDGLLDIIVSSGSLATLRNLGGGLFDARSAFIVDSTKSFPIDIDWDGRLDLLLPTAGAETVLLNTKPCRPLPTNR
jgi:hypothetical protein